MLSLLITLTVAYALIPGVITTLPPGNIGLKQWIVHGILFAVLYVYVLPHVRVAIEGFDNPDTRKSASCPPGYVSCGSGDCRRKGDKFSPCA